MIKIRIVGPIRGFFNHVINEIDDAVQFSGQRQTYEIPSSKKVLISNLLRTKVVGFFGIFKINDVRGEEDNVDNIDYLLSFNRFLKSDKPYYIYLENPTALCNYSLTCLQSPFIKKKLEKCINDDNLRKIICMSESCMKTIEKVLQVSIPTNKLTQIYPYVPQNKYITEEILLKKSEESTLKLLYIAQGSRFKSKGGMEIVEAFKKIKNDMNISITIITNIEDLAYGDREEFINVGVSLIDFKLSYQELEQIYVKHHILLQPSSDDSFGLTVLEAMKAGLPIIASRMYAFKEMVNDGENGFLVEPSYYFFAQNDLPNPAVWNHREKTIYSGKVNNKLVRELIAKISILYEDRKLLYEFSKCSLEKADYTFGKRNTLGKWKELV